MDKGNEHKHAASFSLLGSSLHIGFFIVVSVLFFVLAGVWLDKKFNTVPLFIILGVLLSLAASMYEVYRIIRKVGGSGDTRASKN
ncbi:MAG: hypothetical protein A3H69_04700 [Candidatus Sungbacteria bacterium RIFCSPLOWO2_02_FULL_47_9]|uniref:AtpZ/AtpI family protein n=1 Tax=Candidatus Sungbacteria bacterium RIFCSPHIGHO2_01_FULL_47_32 TaxID=1802264 RepID=A0A1G2K258_9BACT|nr:MAG: hypothetical protein UX72_C0010G0033 [Parcubacteria group bacterium GW2011_GWA2_47_10]OGZ93492.1 MAG: hypothetical protein A2633_06410 [Candidatus Sungbacteria bacterium RIFCSPHIGHO2_01_FULL_47_32]OGZ97949.1 MAG: hypothetical protein A3D57_04985 [Candidatus Sungbacteria bacterium RIFCSPHIGHO2_02_FULL_46_12]OHA04391.1 MAG: hypothetical protein A3A28_03660 [Candidatus Sungbacteria bacterium RIFCSPLOWO2_01_FULL_47_32]OHA11896.1 MAG: hypothetical protein A3H69_04700 [Candidatus Sungbacteria